MSLPSSKPVVALALALLLVTSATAAVAAGAPAPAPSPESEDPASVRQANETVEPADTVYVTDDGDAILEYRSESDDAETSGQFGVNVSEGLVHMLVSADTETNATGSLSAVLERDRFEGNGSVVSEKPEDLESLNLTATATQDEDRSAYDFVLRAAGTADGNASASGSLETEGQVRVTPDRYESSGHATATETSAIADRTSQSIRLVETDDGYVLSVARNGTVGVAEVPDYATRNATRETLESQYASVATTLGGAADIEIDTYAFDNASRRLDLDYTVTYSGVKANVTERLAENIATAQNVSMSESEAQDAADRLTALTVDEIAVSTTVGAERSELNWTIALSGYGTAQEAMLDVVAAGENLDDETREEIAAAQDRLAARQAAGLERTVTWQGSLETEGESVTADYEVHGRTTNWADYVAELQSRDRSVGAYSYTVSARSRGDEVETTISVTLEDEDLLASLVSEGGASGGGDNAGAETIRDLREAGFERAKMNVSFGNGTATMRAAGSFENASALAAALADTYGGEVTSVAGRSEDGESVTYVRVNDLVGPDASEDDVRATPVANGSTEVRMPGDWDREFPRMDVVSVESYLGSDDDEADDQGGPIPGFGATSAALALLVAAIATIAAVRRRR